MLHFQKLTDIQAASSIISDRLSQELSASKQVVWLLSGGSNIGIELAAIKSLSQDMLSRLTIMLNDERYGPYGHKDSNLQQLIDAGLSSVHVKVIPVLVPESLPLEATTAHYAENIQKEFAAADVIISQLGMGSDGHIAGILPNTEATTATDLVTNYTTEQFVRITLTFDALKQVSAVYLFAFGEDKRAQLEQLYDQDIPLSEQPVQFLKYLPEAYVYNDQLDIQVASTKGEK